MFSMRMMGRKKLMA
jgi:hypothetical protein